MNCQRVRIRQRLQQLRVLVLARAQHQRGATKPDGITPEIEAYLNSELAKARRTAEAAGKTQARTELEEEAASANATTEEKLTKAKNDLAAANTAKLAAETQLRKLLMAIKVGLPNPDVNWKRLIDTDDDAALEEDAMSLKASFVTQAPASPPPVTPSGRGGGRSTTEGTRSEEEAETVTKVAAQAQEPMYTKL